MRRSVLLLGLFSALCATWVTAGLTTTNGTTNGNGTVVQDEQPPSNAGVATVKTVVLPFIVPVDLSTWSPKDVSARAEQLGAGSSGSQVTVSFGTSQSVEIPGFDKQHPERLCQSAGKLIAASLAALAKNSQSITNPCDNPGLGNQQNGQRRSLQETSGTAQLTFTLNSRTLADAQLIQSALTAASSSGQLVAAVQTSLQQQLQAAQLDPTLGVDTSVLKAILAGGLVTPAPASHVVYAIEVTSDASTSVAALQQTLGDTLRTVLSTQFKDDVANIQVVDISVPSGIPVPAVTKLEIQVANGAQYSISEQTSCVGADTVTASYAVGVPVLRCKCGLLRNATMFPDATVAVQALAGINGDPQQALLDAHAWDFNNTKWNDCTTTTSTTLSSLEDGFYQYLVKCSTMSDQTETWITGLQSNFKIDTTSPRTTITPIVWPQLGIHSWDPAAFDFKLPNKPNGVFTFNVSVTDQCINNPDSVSQPGVELLYRWDNQPWSRLLDAPHQLLEAKDCRKDYLLDSPQLTPGAVYTLQVKAADCAHNEELPSYYSFYFSNDAQTGSHANCRISYVLDSPKAPVGPWTGLPVNTFSTGLTDMVDGVYFLHLQGIDTAGNAFPPGGQVRNFPQTSSAWVVDTNCPNNTFVQSWDDDSSGDAQTVPYVIRSGDHVDGLDVPQPQVWLKISQTGNSDDIIVSNADFVSSTHDTVDKRWVGSFVNGQPTQVGIAAYDEVGNHCPDQDLADLVTTEPLNVYLGWQGSSFAFCKRSDNLTKAIAEIASNKVNRVAFPVSFSYMGQQPPQVPFKYNFTLTKYNASNCSFASAPVQTGAGEGQAASSDIKLVFNDIGNGLFKIQLAGSLLPDPGSDWLADPSPFCAYFIVDQGKPSVTIDTSATLYNAADVPIVVRGSAMEPDTAQGCLPAAPKCKDCTVQLELSPSVTDEKLPGIDVDVNGNWLFTLPDDLPHGDYNLKAVVVDAAGKSSKPANWQFSIDLVAPDTVAILVQQGSDDTQTYIPRCVGEKYPEQCSFLYSFDGYQLSRAQGPIKVARGEPGVPHQIRIWAVDAAGNQDPTPFTQSWFIDVPVTPPVQDEEPPFKFPEIRKPRPDGCTAAGGNCFSGSNVDSVPDDNILFSSDEL